MSEQPTDEQIKEFWEWCGLLHYVSPGEKISYEDNHWVAPDCTRYLEYPPIDLNNLFKYAVPKVYDAGYWMQWFLDSRGCDIRIHHLNTNDNHSIHQDEDPALALFWAIYKVIKENK